MDEAARITLLTTILLAVMVGIVGGFLRSPAGQPQAVAAAMVNYGEGGLSARWQIVPRTEAPGEAKEATPALTLPEVPEELGAFQFICVVPLAGALPQALAEEGPPWHFVITREGEVLGTRRLAQGRPAVPPGFEPQPAARCLHVVIPFATRDPKGARRVALLGLLRFLAKERGFARAALRSPAALIQTPALPLAALPLEELFDAVFRDR